MKKFFSPCLAIALLVCAGSAFGQQTPSGAASDATNKKIHKLDLLIKLVPLVLKKSQYAILMDAVVRARAMWKDEQASEDKVLADMEPTVSTAVDNAVEKGVYPPRDMQESISKKLDDMQRSQLKVNTIMIKTVYDAIESSLNEGQRKTMEGSFSDAFVSPSAPSAATPDVKLRFYVRAVFLDPDAYDLLAEMSKRAS